MTKLTIELDDAAAQFAAERARQANLTLSEWISQRIAGRQPMRAAGERDALGYPAGWFERTAGSLSDLADFCEPTDPPLAFIAPLEL